MGMDILLETENTVGNKYVLCIYSPGFSQLGHSSRQLFYLAEGQEVLTF